VEPTCVRVFIIPPWSEGNNKERNGTEIGGDHPGLRGRRPFRKAWHGAGTALHARLSVIHVWDAITALSRTSVTISEAVVMSTLLSLIGGFSLNLVFDIPNSWIVLRQGDLYFTRRHLWYRSSNRSGAYGILTSKDYLDAKQAFSIALVPLSHWLLGICWIYLRVCGVVKEGQDASSSYA
jgi:hypothetical protein